MSLIRNVIVQGGELAVTNLLTPHPVTGTVDVGNWPTDLFHRVQVAAPSTLFDSQFTYEDNPLRWEKITASGGSVNYSPSLGAVSMGLTGTLGSLAAIQTYQYHPYQPGRAQLVRMTFNAPNTLSSTVVSRIGLFDANNGIYYRKTSQNTHAFVIRYNVGLLQENIVEQADWNIDPMDGTGPSQITLDGVKAQILLIDAQWLGVGSVIVGFDINGVAYPCHKFNHANIIQDTYTRTLTLPLRYEITNPDGNVNNNGQTLQCYCSTVVSSGGDHEPHGFEFATRNTALRTCPVGGLPLISIRPRTTYGASLVPNRILVIPEGFGGASDAAGMGAIDLLYGAVVTGGAWVNVDSNSGMEVNFGGTAFTGGIRMGSEFIPSSVQAKSGITAEVKGRYPIALNAAGANVDRGLTVVGYGIGGSRDLVGKIEWREVR